MQRLQPVLRLDIFHRFQIIFAKNLGAAQQEHQIGIGTNDFHASGGAFGFAPIPANQQITGLVWMPNLATRTQIGKVIGEKVHELEAPIALVQNCWHGQHLWLSAQIEPARRVCGVIIGRDHILILGR